MFKSIIFKQYAPNVEQYIYELEDSEFGIVEAEVVVGVAREYPKRGLNVGKNLAVAVIWYCETYKFSVKDLCKWQNKHYVFFPNWKEYATSRDEYLTKLLLIG